MKGTRNRREEKKVSHRIPNEVHAYDDHTIIIVPPISSRYFNNNTYRFSFVFSPHLLCAFNELNPSSSIRELNGFPEKKLIIKLVGGTLNEPLKYIL